jgi:tRNA (guanosine-2'-O-)-methyltransferase
MQAVLDSRLGAVRVVVENVHDPHNISAVLRSAEALGVQHVHVVEAASGFGLSRRITRGAHKWLTVHRHHHFSECSSMLRNEGFRLYAAMLGHGAVPLEAIPVDVPVALVFGNEKEGVSPDALAACHGCYTIPMAGFVQSFNISVAAAVSLYSLTTRVRAERPDGGKLSESEHQAVLEEWLPRSLRCGRRVVRAAR